RRVADRRRRAAALMALVVLGTGPAGAAPAAHTIVIENMQFSPAALTVKRGDRVVWVNKDLVSHTATAAKAFDSHDIAPTRSWTYVARKPGRYAYVCTLHPVMKASLTVK